VAAKNGPALTGHGAEAVRDAIAASITMLPEQLRRSLTWDQGAEMAQHAQLRIDADIDVYFCDPHSPWQRGSNENTNGRSNKQLLRRPLEPGQAAAVCMEDRLGRELAVAMRHLKRVAHQLEVARGEICQPTTRFVARQITTERYAQPAQVRR
jgi:hypothetical protein